jgi:hypothetical protein
LSEEIDILLKIGNKFYEGKLHPQEACQHVSSPLDSRRPLFPEPFSEMLNVTDQGTYWEVKPKMFLQTADFAEIARLVKQYGGDYVSAGKSSHFRVPKA